MEAQNQNEEPLRPEEADPETGPEDGQQESPPEEHTERGPVTISFAEYQELKTLAQERDEYLKRLRRSVADHVHMKNRFEKLRETARQEALRNAARKVVPLADSLARALEVAEQTEGAEQICEGLRLTQEEFHSILRDLGVEPIEALGEPFDPNYHEAMFQVPTDEVEPNVVVQEVKKGFLLNGKLLRPAQVVVSAPPQAHEEHRVDEEV